MGNFNFRFQKFVRDRVGGLVKVDISGWGYRGNKGCSGGGWGGNKKGCGEKGKGGKRLSNRGGEDPIGNLIGGERYVSGGGG